MGYDLAKLAVNAAEEAAEAELREAEVEENVAMEAERDRQRVELEESLSKVLRFLGIKRHAEEAERLVANALWLGQPFVSRDLWVFEVVTEDGLRLRLGGHSFDGINDLALLEDYGDDDDGFYAGGIIDAVTLGEAIQKREEWRKQRAAQKARAEAPATTAGLPVKQPPITADEEVGAEQVLVEALNGLKHPQSAVLAAAAIYLGKRLKDCAC